MKTLVDCDYVFDVLTRGPYPCDDEPLESIEQHLVSCYECRMMAEALRPATEVIHEALTPEERKSLPEFRDSATMQRIQRTIVDAVFHQEVGRAEKVERSCKRWLSPAFVLVPTAMVLMLFGAPKLSVWIKNAVSSSPSTVGKAEDVLLGLSIPVGCLTPVNWKNGPSSDSSAKCTECHENHFLVSLPENSGYHCCTTCHFAGSDSSNIVSRAEKVNFSQFMSVCAACHHSSH